MSRSRSNTSGGSSSSYPKCGILKLDERRRWYGWLRSMKSVEDLKKPGMVGYWDILTHVQKLRVRAHIVAHLGGERKLKEFYSYLREMRKKTKLRVNLARGRTDKPFILAMNERLSSSADILVTIEQKGLVQHVLLLASAKVPVPVIAESCGLDENSIEHIASPTALAAFQNSDIEVQAVEGMRKMVYANLYACLHTQILEPDMLLKFADHLTRRAAVEIKRDAMDQKRGRRARKVEDYDAFLASLDQKHKKLMQQAENVPEELSLDDEEEASAE